PTPATRPSAITTSASSARRVKTFTTRPPVRRRSPGSLPRATRTRRPITSGRCSSRAVDPRPTLMRSPPWFRSIRSTEPGAFPLVEEGCALLAEQAALDLEGAFAHRSELARGDQKLAEAGGVGVGDCGPEDDPVDL